MTKNSCIKAICVLAACVLGQLSAAEMEAQSWTDTLKVDMEAEAQSAREALERLVGADSEEAKDQATTQYLDKASPEDLSVFVEKNAAPTQVTPPAENAPIGELDIFVNSKREPLPFPNDEAQFLTAVGTNGEQLGPWKVSTGAKIFDKKEGIVKDHITPEGDFPVVAMIDNATSGKYGGAPMPHAVFFKKGGLGGKHLMYAIHGTEDLVHLGAPASHGCVRLHPDHAKELFARVKAYGPANTHIHILR